MKKAYPLPEGAVRAFDNAARWARELRETGVRQEHGLTANRPLTPPEHRDMLVIEKAVERLFVADRKNRR